MSVDLYDVPNGIQNPLSVEMKVEYLEQHDSGYLEEWIVVKFIRAYLLTADQHRFLSDNFLSIQEILNGRVPADISDKIENEFFPDWNVKLGKKVFGF